MAGINILGALLRMVTLPKAHNSLSDILGAAQAKIVTDTLHDLLAGAVGSALHALIVTGEQDIAKVQAFVTQAAVGALKSVDPALASSIAGIVAGVITSVEHTAESALVKDTEQIVAGIGRLLNIAQ